ncbi:thermonuclease family protein [Candidatus Bipolaricaulota bacterium]|nr:thermonuclease family protein [Candidatus Bipolaricaulota bacterium]
MEVRYLNLDTPETHHPEKPVEYFGVKASKFNQQLVEGKKVKLEYDVQKKDQYNRHLAYVYVKQDGEWININAELLREGYARVYTLPPNVKYADYFLELEREARENCRGLWQAYCEGPPVLSAKEIEEKMDEYLGEVVTVRYRVIGTYDSGDIIFLNSSNDYETDFTAVIFSDDKKYFIRRGIEPVRDYNGKTIEVTGELQEYDGPEIILYHPYQVEVVG